PLIYTVLYILAILAYPLIFYVLLGILLEYFRVTPITTITVSALFMSGFIVACAIADGVVPAPFVPRAPWLKVVQPMVYGLVGASGYMTTVWERQNPGRMDEALGWGVAEELRRREEIRMRADSESHRDYFE
ncbi:hypothetical protein BDZ89DRAFT_1076857, partial [Hymenopellis radicata]